MNFNLKLLLVCAVSFGTCSVVSGHAHQTDPLRREKNGGVLNCGTACDGVGYRQDDARGSRCGVCGDPVWFEHQKVVVVLERPLDHEYKGKWWNEVPVEAYVEGQTISVYIEFWNAHGGYAEWRICSDTTRETYNQSCFDEHLLEVIDTNDKSGKFVPVSVDTDGVTRRLDILTWDPNQYVTVRLRLPADLDCTHCVLQFSTIGSAGQMFRSCADIQINPYVQLLQNSESGLCLSLKTDEGYDLQLVPCDGNDIKQSLLAVGSFENLRNYAIYFQSTRKCLDVNSESQSPGAKIGQYKCEKDKRKPYTHQSWSTINKTDDSQFLIQNQKSQLCLTASMTGTYQNPCMPDQATQRWKVKQVYFDSANQREYSRSNPERNSVAFYPDLF